MKKFSILSAILVLAAFSNFGLAKKNIVIIVPNNPPGWTTTGADDKLQIAFDNDLYNVTFKYGGNKIGTEISDAKLNGDSIKNVQEFMQYLGIVDANGNKTGNIDLVVIDANVWTGDPIQANAVKMYGGKLLGEVPVLNFRLHLYQTNTTIGETGRWKWLSSSSDLGTNNQIISADHKGSIALNNISKTENHPLFKALKIDSLNTSFKKVIELYDPPTDGGTFQTMQNVVKTWSNKGMEWDDLWTFYKFDLATCGSVGSGYSVIHEINIDGTNNKYLGMGILKTDGTSVTNGKYLSVNGVQIIKNAIAYLTDNTAGYDYDTDTPIGGQTDLKNLRNETCLRYFSKTLSNSKALSVTVYNSLGFAVMKAKDTSIDVSTLDNGIYIAKDETGGTLKFLKR